MTSLLPPFVSLICTDAIALTLAVRLLVRAKNSQGWPRVEAVVLRARVLQAGKGSRPAIDYRYHVAGHTYESGRVVVGWMASVSGDGPARLVQRHPVGATASVAVDPDRPGYSVLLPGIRVHQVFISSFTIVGVLMTLPLLWLMVRPISG